MRRQVGGLRQAMLSGTLRNAEIRTPVRCGRIVKWYSCCGKQWRCCTRQHPLSGPSLYGSWVGWAHSHTHTRSSCTLAFQAPPSTLPALHIQTPHVSSQLGGRLPSFAAVSSRHSVPSPASSPPQSRLPNGLTVLSLCLCPSVSLQRRKSVICLSLLAYFRNHVSLP